MLSKENSKPEIVEHSNVQIKKKRVLNTKGLKSILEYTELIKTIRKKIRQYRATERETLIE